MKKRTILIAVCTITLIVGFMIWDIYENKQKQEQEALAKAEFEKVYTASDIFGEEGKLTSLNIEVIESTPLNSNPKINVQDEKQQKRMMNAINNLQVQKTLNRMPFQDVDYVITIQLDKEYVMNVFEKEKQIAFLDINNNSGKVDEGFHYQYKILKGSDEFFDTLKNIQ